MCVSVWKLKRYPEAFHKTEVPFEVGSKLLAGSPVLTFMFTFMLLLGGPLSWVDLDPKAGPQQGQNSLDLSCRGLPTCLPSFLIGISSTVNGCKPFCLPESGKPGSFCMPAENPVRLEQDALVNKPGTAERPIFGRQGWGEGRDSTAEGRLQGE